MDGIYMVAGIDFQLAGGQIDGARNPSVFLFRGKALG